MTGILDRAGPVTGIEGPGAIARLPELLPLAGRLLLVTTPGFTRRGVTGALVAGLGPERVSVYDRVTPNPDLDALDAACESLRGSDPAAIVGLGGGSTIDTAKVLSATLPDTEGFALRTRLRERRNRPWGRTLPVVAIPTTAGTGAETTPFATVWDCALGRKYSLDDPALVPRRVLLDPELTLGLPPRETLYGGLDAVSHALESLWNRRRDGASAAWASESLALALDALPRVLADPSDIEARGRMQQASLAAGLAIARTRTAIAHAISYPLTLHFGVPHGLACGFALTSVGSWLNGRERGCLDPFEPLVGRVLELLDGLDLRRQLAQFARPEEVLGLVPQILGNERGANFLFAADAAAVEEILRGAIGWSRRGAPRRIRERALPHRTRRGS
jgi:alcohol dehydrogenase